MVPQCSPRCRRLLLLVLAGLRGGVSVIAEDDAHGWQGLVLCIPLWKLSSMGGTILYTLPKISLRVMLTAMIALILFGSAPICEVFFLGFYYEVQRVSNGKV